MLKILPSLLISVLLLGAAEAVWALDANIEAKYLKILSADNPPPDPNTRDKDENEIIDRAHYRLFDAVLRDVDAPHHSLISTIYTFNSVRIHKDNTLGAACILLELRYHFTCAEYESLAAAQVTIAEPKGLTNLVEGLDQLAGIKIDLNNYNTTAANLLNAAGDLDGDGFSNVQEFKSVCGDFDAYVAAAMNASITPLTLPCCQNCPLVFVTHPQGGQMYAGDQHTFSVSVDGIEGTASYIWYHDGAVVGPNAPALEHTFVLPGDSGEYWCEIRDDRGTLGIATATSQHATLTVANHMSIQTEPQGGDKMAGDSHLFQVGVTGGLGTLHYQWQKDLAPVGPDAPQWSLDTLAETDSGAYQCIISDQAEQLASQTVTLTVAGLPEGEGAAEGEGEGVPGETVYFLVANPSAPEQGSYVLPLTGAEDIAHARAVIADPDGTDRHIVVAQIAQGGSEGDYENRDLLNDGHLWSWRVTGFGGFADNTVEIYDGWAWYVENNFAEWMQTTNGTIGFWTYRVVQEITNPVEGEGEGIVEGEGEDIVEGEGEGVMEGEGEGVAEGEGEGVMEGEGEGVAEGEGEGVVEGEGEGAVEGEGEGAGILETEPAPGSILDFGIARCDGIEERTVTLRNVGTGIVQGHILLSAESAFSIEGPSAFVLTPGATLTLRMKFMPSAYALYTGLLRIEAGTQHRTFYLTGAGGIQKSIFACRGEAPLPGGGYAWGDFLAAAGLLVFLCVKGSTRRRSSAR